MSMSTGILPVEVRFLEAMTGGAFVIADWVSRASTQRLLSALRALGFDVRGFVLAHSGSP